MSLAHRGTRLAADVSNFTNEPQSVYRGYANRMQTTIINGTTVTFGVNGRF